MNPSRYLCIAKLVTLAKEQFFLLDARQIACLSQHYKSDKIALEPHPHDNCLNAVSSQVNPLFLLHFSRHPVVCQLLVLSSLLLLLLSHQAASAIR